MVNVSKFRKILAGNAGNSPEVVPRGAAGDFVEQAVIERDDRE